MSRGDVLKKQKRINCTFVIQSTLIICQSISKRISLFSLLVKIGSGLLLAFFLSTTRREIIFVINWIVFLLSGQKTNGMEKGYGRKHIKYFTQPEEAWTDGLNREATSPHVGFVVSNISYQKTKKLYPEIFCHKVLSNFPRRFSWNWKSFTGGFAWLCLSDFNPQFKIFNLKEV